MVQCEHQRKCAPGVMNCAASACVRIQAMTCKAAYTCGHCAHMLQFTQSPVPAQTMTAVPRASAAHSPIHGGGEGAAAHTHVSGNSDARHAAWPCSASCQEKIVDSSSGCTTTASSQHQSRTSPEGPRVGGAGCAGWPALPPAPADAAFLGGWTCASPSSMGTAYPPRSFNRGAACPREVLQRWPLPSPPLDRQEL
jgi:hypothetical protein